MKTDYGQSLQKGKRYTDDGQEEVYRIDTDIDGTFTGLHGQTTDNVLNELGVIYSLPDCNSSPRSIVNFDTSGVNFIYSVMFILLITIIVGVIYYYFFR